MAEIDQRWHDLGEFIREQRRVGQLSLRKLSEKAGISNPYLSQIERGLRKPSAEILQNIAKALSISAETLYVQAGILDPPADDHDLAAAIRRDPHLDEEQKRTLLMVYESFRAGPGAAAAAGTGADDPVDRGPADDDAAGSTVADDGGSDSGGSDSDVPDSDLPDSDGSDSDGAATGPVGAVDR